MYAHNKENDGEVIIHSLGRNAFHNEQQVVFSFSAALLFIASNIGYGRKV
jgi:hypothetical protein